MTSSVRRHARRRGVGALVFLSLALTPTARAAAHNHDLQLVVLPPAPLASHDHAPGPLLR